MLVQMIYPTVSYAVTGGPASPEFSSFEPVATTNMVNEFSGQFIYNLPVLEIPGASGGGYALSLSYHGGDGPENEASWVGAGWTLNPGAITRNKRGLPDDYKGQSIKYYNSVPRNWTIAATGNFGAEAFSITGTLSATVRYNYYKGFGITEGVGLSGLNGLLSLGFTNNDGTGSFSAGINPGAILSIVNNGLKSDHKNAAGEATKETPKKSNSGSGQASLGSLNSTVSPMVSQSISSYANYMLASSTSPYNLTPFTGSSYTGYVSVTPDPAPLPVGLTGGLCINYTAQDNVKERSVSGYGYMYAGDGYAAKNNDSLRAESIMDYTVENESTFNERDNYLPVPSSTPDAYMLSGEGLGGGFRMYQSSIGVFSPNFVNSYTSLYNFGLDVHLGADIGLGADFTVNGDHNLKVLSSWPGGNGNTDYCKFPSYEGQYPDKESRYFRFNNDLGGKNVYSEEDNKAHHVNISSGGQPNLATASLILKKDVSVPGTNLRSGRSSFIGYHTNKEITTFSGSHRPLAYEQREVINKLAGRADTLTDTTIKSSVGEISVVNEAGNRYTYGLPVYTAGEKSMRQGLIGSDGNRYLPHAAITPHIKIGEEYATPYATQYLLTEIVTPDYLDINGNGPDDADFGGYTKFAYKRAYGNDSKTNTSTYSGWYKWRSPYNGVMYAPNRISDNTDDMGSYQSGYKEVYYLDSIQTKTHYAVFVTDDRNDGIDANISDETAANSNVLGTHRPKCLKEIRLYARATHTGDPDKLVKTIHFEYNYECWPHTINTIAGNLGSGKLTLKKVWFEYNGVINAKISPYQFEYSYPTSVAYPAQYQFIQNEMTAGGALVQNPDYTPYMDCWGNYQYDGYNRRQQYKSWDSQVPDPSFDPAAWQLKRIILPSGGEIHVQYEQNTYSYVQDRNACALVSLIDNAQNAAQGSLYTLNTAEIGANTDAEKDQLVALINHTYHDQKIFFKFFYTLMGLSTQDIGSCNGDYVEGYVNFVTCYRGGTGASAKVYVQVNGLPRDVCKDYIRHQIGGKIMNGDCSSPSYPGDIGLGSSSDIASQLGDLATTFFNRVYEGLPGADICMRAKPEVSYLRIPIPKKRGGGIRVKRLLMYNKGIDVNTPTLYGTQYIYENESNGTSYGVATNEPYENKGENPLVTFLPKRDEQSDWDRLIAGKDREKFEGPESWNVLPGASIGYSRIIKQNIFRSQATGTGYSVIDYNTVKDYPYDRYYAAIDAKGADHSDVNNQKSDWTVDIGILDFEIRKATQAAQSYCFIQNQMHGQIKQISDYRGVYDPVKFYSNTPPVPASQKTYTYFEPGEKIPMYDFRSWSIYYDQPGKEEDITIDRRTVQEHTKGIRVTGDLTVGIWGFIPMIYPIAFPVNSEQDQKMSSLVLNKVIHYPAIQKQVTAMKDGYYQKSDYVAFDPLTTKPVLASTYDGFNNLNLPTEMASHNGKYTQYNVPASSSYKAMGQKAWNEHYCYYSTTSIGVSGSGSAYTVAGVNIDNAFTPGDLVALHYHIAGSSYDGVAMAHVKEISGSNIIVEPTKKYNTTIPSAGYYKAEIVQSGYTNQLNSQMDGFTEYGDNASVLVAAAIAWLNTQIYTFEHSTLPTLSVVVPPEYSNILFINNVLGTGYLPITSYVFNRLSGTSTIWINPYSGTTMGEGYGFAGVTSASKIGVKLDYYFCYGDNSYGYWLDLVDSSTGSVIQDCKFGIKVKNNINIIKAQATTYSDHWSYTDTTGLDTSALNNYEVGLKGKWRPYETYIFRDTIKKGSKVALGQRNYNSGTAPFDLAPWEQIFILHSSKWIKSNHLDKYSPNGLNVEEHNMDNTFSGARYGYRGLLPYIAATNAKMACINFESFENVYGNGPYSTENNMVVDNTKIVRQAHTGSYGYLRNPSETIQLAPTLDASGQGLVLRFWAKVTGTPAGIFSITSSIASASSMTANYLARSGEWALYEAKWQNPGVTNPMVVFTIKNTGAIPYVFDDIKVQPPFAHATCYVYNTGTYQLSAVLDDQHFATRYQYNGEGLLVRTIAETVRGNKTVEESHHHVPMISRP